MNHAQLPAGLSHVDRVVADPLRFKLKLGIGEDAFRSIRYAKVLQEAWGAGGVAAAGAAAASSSAVATTFFASSGWLAAIGLGAAAVTPIGWVLGAAMASGGAYYGVMRAVRSYSRSRVHEIPRFISTPLDLMAVNILDMLGSLAVRLAQCDGRYDDSEGECIRDYFVVEWGYDPGYVESALEIIAAGREQQSLEEMAVLVADFGRSNPDCDFVTLRREVAALLQEIAETDGEIDPAEEEALRVVSRTFESAYRSTSVLTRAARFVAPSRRPRSDSSLI